MAGPLTLPAGDDDIALTKPGEAIRAVDNATVPGGADISLAAHLSARRSAWSGPLAGAGRGGAATRAPSGPGDRR